MGRHPRLDRSRLKTRSRRGEKRRFNVSASGSAPDPSAPFRDFLDCMPDVLAARELRAVARAIADAHRRERPVLVMVGASVVKTGCSPILIELMEQRVITALALSGATAIHDYELACFGDTSEDVSSGLRDGSFGMWEETGAWMNAAASESARLDEGLGEGLGRDLAQRAPRFLKHSLMASAYRLGIPLTVHVALGTDIIHQHPAADGRALGQTSMADLDVLAQILTRVAGGVVMNLGSAVVLPEVFLKALTMARNVGADTQGMVLVNCDLQAHYRTRLNLLERPAQECGGTARQILAPHEILLPLLAGMVRAELGQPALSSDGATS